ncbi:response regulator transcription factor [Sphingomonas sp. IC-56]|uniref:response regulator transcription factor n=1 Tax=Sphingomonas sp. IC-56 TaxID=2898529 RepID=UPI001E4BB630|nr:response regulator transcription factor [Sphingomonas sp. IC-56]MCD2324325.1 response regulator transcription factor [Sphingomonas sp. IC-56]
MSDRRLLIIEDDAVLARTLARSFERRGYQAVVLGSPTGLAEAAEQLQPTHAIIDLRLGGASGLGCIRTLHEHDEGTRIVVLTGFASIATAVEAIKLGATNYLTKPANTDDIEAAFDKVDGDEDANITTRPTSIKTLEWEHIHQVLVETDFNISEAARRLGLHRRTLVRKLEKRHI